MTDRELLQQALDTLRHLCLHSRAVQGYDGEKVQSGIDALKSRLAQPESAECDGGQCGIGGYCKQCPKTQPENEFAPDWNAMAVMVEEQQRMSKRIEELEAALAQPEQEPAWIKTRKITYMNFTEQPQQPEQEIESDRPHVENDGCPTEKAVLQRFWREHQKQEPVRLQCVICGTVYADGVPPQVAQPKQKLWLWKNFVDGRPEYWAFDNPYPTNLDNGDPQTLGQPCGYAIFKPSSDGSCGRTEEQVLREMKSVIAPPQREWQGLTDEEAKKTFEAHNCTISADLAGILARAIEVKLKEKNG